MRTYRRALGLSQSAFAAQLNVPLETYRPWDAGRREPPPQLLTRVPGGSPAGHEAAGGDREATPRWRVWPCAGEWHPAFRHAPAAGPGVCSCSAASACPVAACATIAGRFVSVARA